MDIASEIKEMATLYGLRLLNPEKVPQHMQGLVCRYLIFFYLFTSSGMIHPKSMHNKPTPVGQSGVNVKRRS